MLIPATPSCPMIATNSPMFQGMILVDNNYCLCFFTLLFILIIFRIRPTILNFFFLIIFNTVSLFLSHKNLYFCLVIIFLSFLKFFALFPFSLFLFIIFKEYFNKFYVPLGVGLRHGPYSTLPLSCTTESLLSPSSYSGQPSSSSAGR